MRIIVTASGIRKVSTHSSKFNDILTCLYIYTLFSQITSTANWGSMLLIATTSVIDLTKTL